MIVKRLIAEVFETVTEFLERPGLPRLRYRHFDTFTEMERFEGPPVNFFRMGTAIFIRNAKQVGSYFAKSEVPAYIRCGQLLGEHGTIEPRENPLRKIIGKPLREKVVAPQALKGMVKNRCVVAFLQAIAQSSEGRGRLISDPRQIRNRDEPEWMFWLLQDSSSASRSKKMGTSAGSLSRK